MSWQLIYLCVGLVVTAALLWGLKRGIDAGRQDPPPNAHAALYIAVVLFFILAWPIALVGGLYHGFKKKD